MVPKVIHYCWFGGNKLPDEATCYINSWKKYCPEYEIVEWNETNFDINICDYVREAYCKKKWAFVSDYARFWIIYNYGGIYFDTDVEMIRPIDDIVKRGGFMAIEDDGRFNIAPGLGIAAEKHNKMYKRILDYYSAIHFVGDNGELNEMPVGEHITQLFLSRGYEKINRVQKIEDITIYPTDYFCPQNVLSKQLSITKNTRTIHHYTASWMSETEKLYRNIENKAKSKGKMWFVLARIFTFPLRIVNKINTVGFGNTVKFVLKKIKNEKK